MKVEMTGESDIMHRFLNRIWLFLLWFVVFIFVITPVIKLGGTKVFALKVFPPLLTLFAFAYLKHLPKRFLVILFALVLVLSFSLGHYIVAAYKDNTFLLRVGVGIFMLIGSLLLVNLFKKAYGSLFRVKLIDAIVLATTINALVMCLQILYPPFLNAVSIFFEITTLLNSRTGIVERINGLTSSGGAVLSVLFSFSLILLHYRKKISQTPPPALWYRLLVVLLNLIGIVLSGRSGMVVLLLYFSYHFLANFSFTFLIKAFGIALIAIISALYVLDSYAGNSNTYFLALKRSFEVVLRLRDEGVLRTDSSDDLMTMFILPEKTGHLFVGDGNFGRKDGLAYVDSDVFYVRVVYGLGFLGLLIFLLPFLTLAGVALSQKGKFQPLLIFMVVVSLILNVKEVFYFGTAGYTQVVFLILTTHLLGEERWEESRSRIQKLSMRAST